jgi:hypothetical protein
MDTTPRDETVERVARAGLAAKGVLYAVTGLLAARLALGDAGGDASQSGALRTLAQQPFGRALVSVLAVGFLAYAVWRAAEGLWPRLTGEDSWQHRAIAGVRATVYAGLAVLAGSVVAGGNGGGSNGGGESRLTARVLELPGGVVLVAAAGVVLLGVAVRQVQHVARGDVTASVEGHRPALVRLGIAGTLARALAFALIGGFVVVAAVQRDPEESRGLDGALQSLAQAPAGPWLIGAVGLGLLAYGLFFLALAWVGDVEQA